MADKDAFFTPDEVDEQVDLLAAMSTSWSPTAQPSPEVRLIEDLHDVQAEALLERSLKRAWERLERSRTAPVAPRRGRFEALIRPGKPGERPSAMSRPTVFVPGGKRLIARLGALAAVLFMVALVVVLSAGLVLVWHHDTGNGLGHATPAVTVAVPTAPAQVNLYLFFQEGSIEKIDTATRTVVWTYMVPHQKAGGVGFGTALVGDGSVYFAAGASASSQDPAIFSPYALDAGTGKLRWHHQTSDPNGIQPLLIGKGVLYVNAADGLQALDASDGSERWHAPLGTFLTSLVLANGVLYGATLRWTPIPSQWSSSLFALNAANGTVLWQAPLPKGKAFDVEAGDKGILYLSSAEYHGGANSKPEASYIYAYSQDGKQLWQSQRFNGLLGNLAVADGVIYFSFQANDTLGTGAYALNANDGALLWQYQAGAGAEFPLVAPIVSKGAVYLDSNPVIVSSRVAATLIALNGRTGAVSWKQQVLPPAQGGASSLALANGSLYLIVAKFGPPGYLSYGLESFSLNEGAPGWQMSLGRSNNAWVVAAP